jgi:hypothetical protein
MILLEEDMTIRRVQGVNVPYTYPDHNNVRTASDSDETIAQKTPETSKQTSQIGELKQEGVARSLELNSKIPNSTQQSVIFKGDIVGLEPYAKGSDKETRSSYSLPYDQP